MPTTYIAPEDLPEELTPAVVEWPGGIRSLRYVSQEGVSNCAGDSPEPWRPDRGLRVVCLLAPIEPEWPVLPDGPGPEHVGATVERRVGETTMRFVVKASNETWVRSSDGGLFMLRHYGVWRIDPSWAPVDPMVQAVIDATDTDTAADLVARLRGGA